MEVVEHSEIKVQKKWYAVYTRARAEKRLYKALIDKGVDAFLPLQKSLRQWSDRKKIVELPLFTSYVFVYISPHEYETVLHTQGAIKYICFEGKAVSIPQEQIDNLRLLIDSDAEIETSNRNYRPGQQVEVLMGSLKGLKGELIKLGNQNRVLIRIDNLEQNLLVNIPQNYLQ